MKKDELWKIYTSKNPAFAGDGNITMSAQGLRKLFNQTYDAAHTQGVANGKALVEMAQRTKPFNPFAI